MSELHQSSHQRKLIAEINAPFKPDLIVLDGIDAFVDGGPANGKRAKGNVFLAATDRVAIDAVGLAILQYLGSNNQIMNTKIFEQEQIARAAEIRGESKISGSRCKHIKPGLTNREPVLTGSQKKSFRLASQIHNKVDSTPILSSGYT
jgi:uncharacterized protein (DUF362 family)